ncbi:MAG: NUDIX domain-containing protein, partial [Streptomycetaceae bacterium]|nr:NUDIX domain-containing protein [Streptomycetaceae bacterium]
PRAESWETEWLPENGMDITGRSSAGAADRAARVARMPKVSACAVVLYRNAVGQVLFVDSTYREDGALLLPGGMVDGNGETPREAAAREVEEEFGVALPVGRILATDWTAATDRPPLSVTVFDGGVLTETQIASLVPGADGEVAAVVWSDPRLGGVAVPAAAARRIEAALLAAEISAGPHELVDGRITGTVCANSGKPPTATARRKDLAGRLAAAGHLPDPRWRRAVEQFPREEFLPGAWAPRALPRRDAAPGAGRDGGWTHLDGAGGKGRAELAWRATAGGPVTVAVGGAERVEPGMRLFTGTAHVTTVALPRYLRALHALELPTQARVLVLGAGAGLGAGLIHTYLRHRSRLDPRVCAVEIDTGLAETLRERLHQAGMRIPVVAADALAPGFAAHPDLAHALGAPADAAAGSVDRLVADFPVDHLPAAWLRLLAPGGRLAAFLTAGQHVPPALLVLESRPDRPGATGTLTPLPADTAAAPGPATPQADTTAHVRGTGTGVLRHARIGPGAVYDPGFLTTVAHLVPSVSWTDHEPVRVHDRATGATALLQRYAGRWTTRTRGGNTDPWAKVEAAHRLWEQAGRPQEYRVDADPDGTLRIFAEAGVLAWIVPAPTPRDSAQAAGGPR